MTMNYMYIYRIYIFTSENSIKLQFENVAGFFL